jgi:hypothetical protein
VDVRVARAEVVFLGESGGSKGDNPLLFKRNKFKILKKEEKKRK